MIIAVVFKEATLQDLIKCNPMAIEEIFCCQKFNLWLYKNLKGKQKRTLFMSTVSIYIAAEIIENITDYNVFEYASRYPCYESWKSYLIEL